MQRCIWQDAQHNLVFLEDEVDDVIEAALAMPKIHLDGFHFHSISNNLDSNLHVDVVKLLF